MARKARVEFAGAVYHMLNRGARREAIFRDEADHERFLSTLGEACAFVLMHNHYDLVVETPQANLVAEMRCFQTTRTPEGGLARPELRRDELASLNQRDARKAALLSP